MTVKELRKLLKGFNEDAKVFIAVEDDFYNGEIESVTVSSEVEPRVYLTTKDNAKFLIKLHENQENLIKKEFVKWKKKKNKKVKKHDKRK